jgi:predicted alpha/beta-hydrolase family hydrolase
MVDTPRGPAGVRISEPDGPAVSLVALGHGAGGTVDAPDLAAVHDVLVPAGVRVALVTQPYRVAGRRVAAPVNQLDEAWSAVVAELTAAYPTVPLIVGGRSSGARVACRTAASLGAAGVLCLAFPLHPPGKPEKSRAAELPAELPTLVLNGDRDPFGVPEPRPGLEVQVRPGATHDLRKDVTTTALLAYAWIRAHQWSR